MADDIEYAVYVVRINNVPAERVAEFEAGLLALLGDNGGFEIVKKHSLRAITELAVPIELRNKLSKNSITSFSQLCQAGVGTLRAFGFEWDEIHNIRKALEPLAPEFQLISGTDIE